MLESTGNNSRVNLFTFPRLKQLCSDSKTKSNYHIKNGSNSLNWHNLLSITYIIVSGLQILTTSVQTALETPTMYVTVTSAVFTLGNMVLQRVISNYAFNCLSILHNQASDDYLEIFEELELMIKDIENGEAFDHSCYEGLVHKFAAVTEKSHIQPVRECFLSLCC